jgi:hypothetical protein
VIINPILLAILAIGSAGLAVGGGIASSRKVAPEATPEVSGKDPYRSPAEVPQPPPVEEEKKSPTPKKEKKKMERKPLTRTQTVAVQAFMLTMLTALALVVWGMFYPILNDGLRVTGIFAIIVLAVGGVVSIAFYNDC